MVSQVLNNILSSNISFFIYLTGFIQSGKIRGKRVFCQKVKESQGMSGKVREIGSGQGNSNVFMNGQGETSIF